MPARFWAVACFFAQISCSSSSVNKAVRLTGGDTGKGASAIYRFGCGSCHTIPGIPGAHGLVGPSLAQIADRQYVAGIMPNDATSLELWIRDPHALNANTVMPTLGVGEQEATDIAAYLYSLK